MKKLLAAAAFAFLGTGAFAQTSQGTVAISGGVGFSTGNTSNNSDSKKALNSSFSISPAIGYMIQDGLEIGIGLMYNRSNTENHIYGYGNGTSQYRYTNTTIGQGFGFGPYLKKYFMLKENWAITGKAYVDIAFGKTEHESSYAESTGFTTKNNVFEAGITPGITFFPTEKIGLSATFGSLAYKQNTSKQEDMESTSSNFGFNLNSSTSMISFSYFISR